eukprot:TRINITY_DN2338_c0_g1_i1.p1 TRINITY_DN2338_c0_g1~~TRINITY_DN2338_c0_g1_i1.p1  ORF type:complete len:918 (-),score=294.32 TRINITY_DN2338_c0_g1_i1:67-2820(-)
MLKGYTFFLGIDIGVLKNWLQKEGGIIVGEIDEKTSYLITNDKKVDEYGFFIEKAVDFNVQIVSLDFLNTCKENGKLVDDKPFQLVDNPNIKSVYKSKDDGIDIDFDLSGLDIDFKEIDQQLSNDIKNLSKNKNGSNTKDLNEKINKNIDIINNNTFNILNSFQFQPTDQLDSYKNLFIENNVIESNHKSNLSGEDQLEMEEDKFNMEFSKFQEFSLSMPNSKGNLDLGDGFDIFEQEREDKEKSRMLEKEDEEDEDGDDEYQAFLKEESMAKQNLESMPVIQGDNDEKEDKEEEEIIIDEGELNKFVDKSEFEELDKMLQEDNDPIVEEDIDELDKLMEKLNKEKEDKKSLEDLEIEEKVVVVDRSCAFDDDKPWVHEVTLNFTEEPVLEEEELPQGRPKVWDINSVENPLINFSLRGIPFEESSIERVLMDLELSDIKDSIDNEEDMQIFFYEEKVIKRFIYLSLNYEFELEDEDLKNEKMIDKLCDMKTSASNILTRDKPNETLLDILSSDNILFFLFDWLSLPIVEEDDGRRGSDHDFFTYSDEKKREKLRVFLAKMSMGCWSQISNFLVQERYLELAVFLKANPQYVFVLAKRIHLPSISLFLENCLKMEKSLIDEYPNTAWSKSLFPLMCIHLTNTIKNKKVDHFINGTPFLSLSFSTHVYDPLEEYRSFFTSSFLELILPLTTNGLVFELVVKMLEYAKYNVPIFLEFFCKENIQQILSDTLKNYSPFLPHSENQPQKVTVIRLNVLNLVSTLLQSQNPLAEISLTKSGVLTQCLDFFFQFKMSNILHSTVFNIVSSILNRGTHKIKYWLLAEYKIIDKLLEHKDTTEPIHGFIYKIFFLVKGCKETNVNINTYFNEQAVQFIEKNYNWKEIEEWMKLNEEQVWEKPKKMPINMVMSHLNSILQLLKGKK